MSLRVAMFMPGLRPGSMSWTIYQAFAAALRERDLDFRLWTDAPEAEPPEVAGTEFLPVAAPGVRDRIMAPFTRSQRVLGYRDALARRLRDAADVELLYMEMAYPLAAAARLAVERVGWRGRMVVTPMGEDILRVADAGYGHTRFRWPRTQVARTLGAAAAIRCIAPMVREYVAEHAVPSPVIPLNVAAETVAAARRDAEAVSRSRAAARAAIAGELGDDGPLILSLGRMHPFKGIHVLLEAIALRPELRLAVVGPALRVKGWGDYGAWLARRARELGIADRVRLLGPVPHEAVLRYLAGADALVVPSLLESMNRVCVEAAAAGTPFVVTSSTGVAGFLEGTGAGLVVPPRDPTAIAGALDAVVGGSFRPDRGEQRRLVERFAPERAANDLAELFRAVTP